jgi:nicotinamidase/pyrazinamidase
MKVLIVVDVQNDFCPGGALAVTDGDKIVPVVNNLMAHGEYDLIVLSQDFHPSDHVSFADNHEGGKPFESIKTEHGDQILWPRHCVQGTHGCEFHSELRIALADFVAQKGIDSVIDSYSAFFDNAHLKDTGLRAHLIRESVKNGEPLTDIEVDVCGLALDYCVKATAIDASALGMKTRIILDACRAVDQTPEAEISLLRELRGHQIEAVYSNDILRERCRSRGDLRSRDNERHRGIER